MDEATAYALAEILGGHVIKYPTFDGQWAVEIEGEAVLKVGKQRIIFAGREIKCYYVKDNREGGLPTALIKLPRKPQVQHATA